MENEKNLENSINEADFNYLMKRFEKVNEIKKNLAKFMNDNNLSIHCVESCIVIEYREFGKGDEPFVIYFNNRGVINPNDVIGG